ncbi:2988_t:CDS:2 [Funneliformis geosporum]|uniref:2988_t:CDS:1 n=1 Tax=Funneliformis geosporum TaxID=1117311 RepID=A0A9W4SKT8_9GLOM|nr:2988_t:CDS:2 [Funneliformis geosporum]
MPGWEDSSWGYHGDDGKKFFNADGEPFGPKFMTSDTIGCCLNFINNTVFYTRNGVNLGIAFQDLKEALYPCVGMMSPGGSVGANFGYRKFKYTASDIYSFYMIMWEFIYGIPPFNNEAHDFQLSLNICKGKRPEIIKNIQQCYINLMKRCWDIDPLKRLTASEIKEIIKV